jgi:hypothetical protein
MIVPPPKSYDEMMEETEFNVWMMSHDDPALRRQAEKYAESVGNPSAAFHEYERLMLIKFRRSYQSPLKRFRRWLGA